MAANRVANDLNLARFPSEGRDNYITNHGFMRGWGLTVPTDGATGYGKGCVFYHLDGSGVDTLVYVNNGDKDSCAFTSITSVPAADFGSGGIKADVIAESTAATGVTADGVLLKDNQVTADAFLFSAAGVATLAAAGSLQGDAAAIASQVTFVTASDGTKGVILPTAVEGDMRIVYNTVAATLKVYPGSSDDINDGSANAAIVLPAKQAGIFIAVDATTWLYFGGLGVSQGAALTAGLTAITHTAPGTPDYALQNLVQNTGFGFATADEGNTALSVLLNLQTKVGEIEARLEALGLIAAN